MNCIKNKGLKVISEWSLDYRGIDPIQEKFWNNARCKIEGNIDFTNKEKKNYSDEINMRIHTSFILPLAVGQVDVSCITEIASETIFLFENFEEVFGFKQLD